MGAIWTVTWSGRGAILARVGFKVWHNMPSLSFSPAPFHTTDFLLGFLSDCYAVGWQSSDFFSSWCNSINAVHRESHPFPLPLHKTIPIARLYSNWVSPWGIITFLILIYVGATHCQNIISFLVIGSQLYFAHLFKITPQKAFLRDRWSISHIWKFKNNKAPKAQTKSQH